MTWLRDRELGAGEVENDECAQNISVLVVWGGGREETTSNVDSAT